MWKNRFVELLTNEINIMESNLKAIENDLLLRRWIHSQIYAEHEATLA